MTPNRRQHLLSRLFWESETTREIQHYIELGIPRLEDDHRKREREAREVSGPATNLNHSEPDPITIQRRGDHGFQATCDALGCSNVPHAHWNLHI